MAIHETKDGLFTISAQGVWLPGCYESKRAANFAFRISDEAKARLRDNACLNNDGVITWQDIKDYRLTDKVNE